MYREYLQRFNENVSQNSSSGELSATVKLTQGIAKNDQNSKVETRVEVLQTNKNDANPSITKPISNQQRNSNDPSKENNQVEEIKIPVTRGQLTQDVLIRGTKLDSLTDFKVTISLTMAGKTRKRNHELSLKALGGDLTLHYPSTSKIVRIFTSSTFTDTKFERNAWMEKAYPRLKQYCRSRGYEFQVVDMRWGVRDEATDDHRGTELCLRELQLCQKLSTGPNFVSLLSHKYGYTSLPREIDIEEYEAIYNGTESEEDKGLLQKWYRRDDNSIPPMYVLQTISKLLPDYLAHDQEKKKSAKSQWWSESEALQKTLTETSQRVLGEQEAMKYVISITHLEVLKGILECKDPENQCLWFKRTIKDIENVEPSWQLSRFMECLGPEEKWQNTRKLLKHLKQNMENVLPMNNVHEYTIPWSEKGIDPSLPDHYLYLQEMNDNFEQLMISKIDQAIVKRELDDDEDPLFEECLQHLEFCKRKCQAFGREDELQKIKNYVQGASKYPYVVHASSGAGKTTIMAMAASQAKSWLTDSASIVIKFIGTTSESTDIIPFLQNLTQQMKRVKGEYAYKAEGDIKHISSEFHASLQGVKPGKMVVLFIDALDQFSVSNGARELFWLPRTLPDNVKLVVSTLEESKYGCFLKLKNIIKEDTNFLHVKPFTEGDVQQILNGWLQTDRRTLTHDQHQVLISAFNECPLALFLKLSYDKASTWMSYYTGDHILLQKTVRASINELFRRLEVLHGQVLTSKAFGYLTSARTGLSEAELEDILSCDDDVLNDVYMYWTPPIRRLPPLILVRLKASLEDKHYIVERNVDGVMVMYWYHRQFSEAAYDRYCHLQDRHTTHTGLADFFSGTWAQGNRKPYIDQHGNEHAADRQVAEQPFLTGDRYNTRKLNNLAFHRVMSGDLPKTKKECLCNFQFLIHRLKGTSVRQLLDDFEIAHEFFPNDKAISQIGHSLRLSESALLYDASLLVSQMLGRLPCNEDTKDFLQQCRESGIMYLNSNRCVLTQTGGQLEYALHGDDEDVMFLDMTQDGTKIVTGATSNIVKLWDVKKGKLIRSIEDLDKSVTNVNFVNKDNNILVRTTNKLLCLTTLGDILFNVSYENFSLYVIGGKGKSTLCIYKERHLQFFDLCQGDQTHSTTIQDGMLTDPRGYVNDYKVCYLMNLNYGTDALMALVDYNTKRFMLVDLNSKTTTQFCRVFDGDEEGDGMDIDAIAITKDNTHVIVSSALINDLILFDTKTLEKVRVIQGQRGDYSEKFQLSLDGEYLYFPSKENVVLYNLNTWERSAILRHSHDVYCVSSMDMKTFATICGDSGLWIWNATNTMVKGPVDGFIGTTVSYMTKLPNSYYVVTLVSHGKDFYIQVHDVIKKIKVRQAKIYNDHENGSGLRPRIIGLVTESTILMPTNSRKLKNVSLETMKPMIIYQGRTPKYPKVAILANNQEIATTTRGGSHIKIQCSVTGRTKCVIRTPDSISGKVETLNSGTHGSLLVVGHENSQHTHAIDVINRQTRYVISISSELGFPQISFELEISPDDTFVLFTDRKRPRGYRPGNTTKFISVVYDVDSRTAIDLFDRYQDVEDFVLKGKSDCSIFEAKILNDRQIVTSHDDGSLRVWDSKTGELVKRLLGHYTSTELFSAPGNPYFLSNAVMDREETFRIWSTDTFQCVTSFRHDTYQPKVLCLDGNRGFVTCESKPGRVIHWTLKGNPSHCTREEIHQTLFTGQVLNLATHLIEETDFEDDKDDQDDDEEIVSDEDDTDMDLVDEPETIKTGV
ncbi:NACHT and WD repeat domain-containing protein 2-like [Ostrea edulis]|uniref:NACHT and WD repeat domain-containing protein 2-like n=1 Tax=Ostrea edulis TaxID=37623 RepID=UPI0024AFC0E9|nr:NACHT and WD repeat domain-containing protein 2-like [Ostrea edulis]